MRLLSPAALWWLLLGAVIIFFYLLKLKRKRRVVSSTLLWQRTLEEMEANAPFKKLRRSLLLLLQLAALAALVFSLARPLLTTRALASGSTVIIIDSTASMSARDEDGRSRLERARSIAREMIEGLEGDDRAAIIDSSSRVVVRSPMTSDRAALAAAIEDVRETETPGDLTDALRLATQIAKSERDAGIVIIGDGSGAPLAPVPESPAVVAQAAPAEQVRFVRVGQRADNVGVIALNSRPAEGRRPELFASIANFGDRDRDVGLELRIEGKLVDARSASIKAGERAGVVFDALPLAGGLVELKVGVDDDLAADNLAYTHLPDARPLRIGVSGDNPFLMQALAVNPDFDARRIGASASAEFDCLVIEGLVPPGVIESGRPVLAINPSDVAGLWETTGQREALEVASIDRSHPVNSFLSYSDLHVESAPSLGTAAWLRPVASAASGGLIWAGDDGARRSVLIGFDLAKSDLPLKIEFPLLLANSINWLAGRNPSADERAVRAGQPIIIRGGARKITLTDPSGGAHEIEARDGVITFAGTVRAGLYEASGLQPFAASLLSESESDLAPRDSIKTRAGEVRGQVETFSSEREVWKWLAIAALAVLAIEWWAYHRRI
jgi:hypothetical protein